MFETLVETVLRPFWGVWLMAMFLAVVVHAFLPCNRQRLERHGAIPLRDEDEEGAPWPR